MRLTTSLLLLAAVMHSIALGGRTDDGTNGPSRCDDLLSLLQKAKHCQNASDTAHLDFNSSCSKKDRLQRSVQCVNDTITGCSSTVQSFIKDYVNVHGQYRAALHVCRYPDAYADAKTCLATHKRYVGFCEREQNYVLHEFRESQKDRSIENLTEFTNQLLTVQCSALKRFIECLSRDFTNLCNELTTNMIVKYNLLYLPHVCYNDWAKRMERSVDEAIGRRRLEDERTGLRSSNRKGAINKNSPEYRLAMRNSQSQSAKLDLFCFCWIILLSVPRTFSYC